MAEKTVRQLNEAQKQYIISSVIRDLIHQNGKFSIGEVMKRITFLDSKMEISVEDVKDEISKELSSKRITSHNIKRQI